MTKGAAWTGAPSAVPEDIRNLLQDQLVEVSIASLRSAISPRTGLIDTEHVRKLQMLRQDFPPILVHRSTMQVIDGMHRLAAARSQGRSHIAARFFDGTLDEAFIIAVNANIAHGLPLTLSERRTAATRVLESHPQLSDRSIGVLVGLAARTVSSLRRRSTAENPQLNVRVGQDGRVRPVDPTQGRLRARNIITAKPEASLRQVAREAGISVGTARDVRKRVQAGAPALPEGQRRRAADNRRTNKRDTFLERTDPDLLFGKLSRDPSLRYSETGRALLNWLSGKACGVSAEEWQAFLQTTPPHCRILLVEIAHACQLRWMELANLVELLERRA
ncbi:hypothetical protein [Nonomuraea sp. NPDC050786]|uniref:hypothetical protein n=1 Tax=Nonomuraea sp. NPDC050786 TaxID=3154840 RepID=UPI0033E5DB4E